MADIILYFPTCLEHSDQGTIRLDPYCSYKDDIEKTKDSCALNALRKTVSGTIWFDPSCIF